MLKSVNFSSQFLKSATNLLILDNSYPKFIFTILFRVILIEQSLYFMLIKYTSIVFQHIHKCLHIRRSLTFDIVIFKS